MTPAAMRRPPAENECVRARPLLGTLVEIVACGPNAASVVERAFRAVEEVHRLMSYHDPASEVSRINREGALREVAVSPHTWRVLDAARRIAQASDGLFDVTVAPTLAALGFLPRHADFLRASGQGDWRHVELLPGRRVRLARRVRIDVGGIAKGYAVDRAIEELAAPGVSSARVNAGGDLRVYGACPQLLRVRRPASPTELWPLVELRSGAAATSADYFHARRLRGRRVTPLIDPRTRVSCAHGRSVTVLAQECATADALTKVVHADPRRAPGILASFSCHALMLEEAGGLCRVHTFDPSQGEGWRVQWLPGEALLG